VKVLVIVNYKNIIIIMHICKLSVIKFVRCDTMFLVRR